MKIIDQQHTQSSFVSDLTGFFAYGANFHRASGQKSALQRYFIETWMTLSDIIETTVKLCVETSIMMSITKIQWNH